MPQEIQTHHETRFMPRDVIELELREADAEDETDRPVLTFYAPPYNRWSQVLGFPGIMEFKERFRPGAFANLDSDIIATREHDNARLLGRTSSGTLVQTEKKKGLRSDITLPPTTDGEDTVILAKRGDLRGASFEFFVPDEETGETWKEGKDGIMERTIEEGGALLFQVGPVANPAYGADTAVAIRRAEVWVKAHSIAEREGMRPTEEAALRQDLLDMSR